MSIDWSKWNPSKQTFDFTKITSIRLKGKVAECESSIQDDFTIEYPTKKRAREHCENIKLWSNCELIIVID